MADPVERFAEVAARFCAWAESSPKPAMEEALTALRLLSALYSAALELPEATPADEDLESLLYDRYQTVFRRFGSLPVGYYSTSLDPLKVPSDEVGIGDVADDMASIYLDLVGPLYWYREGRAGEATWEWRFAFTLHFGHHLTSALRVLHLWYSGASGTAARSD